MIKIKKHQYIVLLTVLFALIITKAASAQSNTQQTAQNIVKDDSPAKKDREYYFFKGLKEYNGGSKSEAKEAFIKVLEYEPYNDAAYYYLANISLGENDITSGEMLLKKAIEIDSTNFWYKNLLAKIFLSTKKTKEAVEVYEDIIRRFPQRTDIYYNLVNLYISQEDIIKSEETLDKIEQLAGKSESTVMARFNLLRMAQNWDGALKYLTESDKEVHSPRIETIIGDMYADRYQDSTAIAYYRKALEIQPEYAPAIYGEAELLRRAGKYSMFFNRINSFMRNPSVVSQMKGEYIGQLLQMPNIVQKFRPQMDTLVDNFVQAHLLDTTANFIASAYFAQTGNRDKSLQLMKNLTAQYPNNKSVTFQFLTYLYYSQEWKKLDSAATATLTVFPQNTDFIQLAAIAQYQSGQKEKAIETYKKLEEISLKNNDTANLLTSYSLLGDIYHEIGNKKMSYLNYKKALKIDPSYNPVLNNYAYFLALENKDLKLAYRMSLITVESEPDNPTYLDTFAWILYLMDKPVEAKTHLKHAMLYGGKESAAILDHYAEVLYTLKEYDLAFIYWNQAKALDNTLGIEEKIKERKQAMDNKTR